MRFLFRNFARRDAVAARAFDNEGDAGSSTALVIGLGNPGNEYAQNRHNVGFWCVNRLARRAGMEFGRRGRLASIAEGELQGHRLVLAKPLTFVNRSGDAARELVRRYHVAPEGLIVVYDELDLPLGSLRIRQRGSHGGHNGIRSIISALGTQDFPRVRLGIGRPFVDGRPTRDPEHIATYVLSDPKGSERRELDTVVERAVDAIETLLTEGVVRAMARFNTGEGNSE